MKKFLFLTLALLILVALTSCGGDSSADTAQDPATDSPKESESAVEKVELNITDGSYKVVYDIKDPDSMSIMTDMIDKINTASGVKLSTSNSNNPAADHEIQLGLKSGRSESEDIYSEISGYGNEVYSVYTIRAVGEKIVISASDADALKVAAGRFAEMASDSFVLTSDFDETAMFITKDYKHGTLELVYADDLASEAGLLLINANGTVVNCNDSKKDYALFVGKEDTAFSVKAFAKSPMANVETAQKGNTFEIKVTSADQSKEETYTMTFIKDSYDLNTWLVPYWDGNITYHESVMFVGDDGAPLLYAPKDILSVRSFDLKTEYVEGVDYEVKDGKLYRLEGSKIPHFTWDEFYPTSKETSVSGNAFAGSSKPFVIHTEGTYFHKNQVFVTYTHAENESLFVPKKSEKLHKFVEKLERGEEVNLVFFGDSITAGGNSSGHSKTAPFTPRWSEMVRDAFAAKYPSAKINFKNTAVGGKETVWGISEIDNSVNKYKPDLLVLAFGMNDGGKSTDQFIANTRTMIDKVLAANPDCEILVIGTMLPHSETTYFKNQYLQEAGLYEMAKSYKSVDVVPMTSMHSSILEHKRYFDMTGNNVNHPNDFLIRAYAQTILKTIIG